MTITGFKKSVPVDIDKIGKLIVIGEFLAIILFTIARYTPSVKRNCCVIASLRDPSNNATFLKNSLRDSASS